jgi:hypothetical protein
MLHLAVEYKGAALGCGLAWLLSGDRRPDYEQKQGGDASHLKLARTPPDDPVAMFSST